jgi:hypothetical protein
VSAIIDGGPAFPSNDDGIQNEGMTLRDWLAGQALGAVVADSLAFNMRMIELGKNPALKESDVAKQAYVYADAMLKARGGAA